MNSNINFYEECVNLLNYHVVLTMKDGRKFDGIVYKVDREKVIVLVGEDVMEDEYSEKETNTHDGYCMRQGRRYRRFNRVGFPFAGLAALSLLAYPYLAPPYPYPYY